MRGMIYRHSRVIHPRALHSWTGSLFPALTPRQRYIAAVRKDHRWGDATARQWRATWEAGE